MMRGEIFRQLVITITLVLPRLTPSAIAAIFMMMKPGSTISRVATMIPKWEGLSTRTGISLQGQVYWATICLHIVEIILLTEWILRECF